MGKTRLALQAAADRLERFPDGVGIRIPPYSTVISAIHTLNTTTEPVTGNIRLSIYMLPASEVTVKLAPFHLSYDELDIPPRSTARFSGTCELESSYVNATSFMVDGGLSGAYITPE